MQTRKFMYKNKMMKIKKRAAWNNTSSRTIVNWVNDMNYIVEDIIIRQALSTEATRNPGDHNQNKTDENLMLEVTIRNSKNVLRHFSEKRWRRPKSIFLRFWD